MAKGMETVPISIQTVMSLRENGKMTRKSMVFIDLKKEPRLRAGSNRITLAME